MKNLVTTALTCVLLSCSPSVEVKNDQKAPQLNKSLGSPTPITVDYVQSIIDRSKILLHHLPDSNSKVLYTEALARMKVYVADSSLTIMRDTQDYKFSVVIVDRTLQPKRKTGIVTALAFDWDEFDRTSEVIIDIDARLGEYTQDLDAIASVLLHELMHAAEANDYKGKPRPQKFDFEMNGWLTQTYVYFTEHMDVLESVEDCDCNTLKVTMKEGVVPKDVLVRSMIQFQFCKQQFIQHIYGR